jgi:hypothetical protein
MPEDPTRPARREFLFRSVAGVAAAAGAAPLESHVRTAEEAPIPTIRLGIHTVTRLIAGGNPVGGWGHSVPNMSRHMLEYFTLERTVEFLGKCEREGINTWQFDHEAKIIQALKIVRERGSKIQFICLHAEREKDSPLARVIADQKPIAIVHHGGVTDRLFREGKAGQVRDFVKKVRDLGVLAGVSSHNPTNIRRIADEGWENDLFMTCFYFVTRTAEEQRRLLGRVTVGEPFFDTDPDEMTAVVRQVKKPCLGFKILAAGRSCDNQKSVAAAFQYAFRHIKPTDAVIVGMYPRFEDEVHLNADYTRTYGAVGT